jgi:transcriptional regulator
LNQHRPESHAKLHAAYEASGDQGRELARWMERIGLMKEE